MLVTSERLAHLLILIRVVAAVVMTITPLMIADAQVIVAFKLVLRAVPAIRESWTTAQFITQIMAVSFPIAFQLGSDAMSRIALEVLGLSIGVLDIRTSMRFTANFITAISAIVIMVTSVPSRNADFIVTLELGFRAVSVTSRASLFAFVSVVSTIVFKIAEPSLRNASAISTFEVARSLVASRTVFVELIRAISAIIFAITEQPFGDAPVIGMPRASSPACGTVVVPTQMCRLVRVVAAVIVEITFPQHRDAFAVVTRELGVRVTFAIMADFISFIGAIGTILVSIAFPGS